MQERLESGVETVGDEDIARALLAACKGAIEPVLNTYDQLLSNGAILPPPNLRLRFMRSVLVVLREWAMSVFAQRMGTSTAGASLILGGSFSVEQTAVINQGIRDRITSAANRSACPLKSQLLVAFILDALNYTVSLPERKGLSLPSDASCFEKENNSFISFRSKVRISLKT